MVISNGASNAELELPHRTPYHRWNTVAENHSIFSKIGNRVFSWLNTPPIPMPEESQVISKSFEKSESHNRSFRHPLLDFSERLGSSFNPSEFPLFQTVDNWGHDGTKILDKPPVKSG